MQIHGSFGDTQTYEERLILLKLPKYMYMTEAYKCPELDTMCLPVESQLYLRSASLWLAVITLYRLSVFGQWAFIVTFV